MARPKKIRLVSRSLRQKFRDWPELFSGRVGLEELNVDELEAIRLCDVLELEQIDAAKKMLVSRPTVQRLLYAGRKKLGDALLGSKALKVVFPQYVSFARKELN
jgi:predicted DNA-binding protein (UPF0251 family)